MESDHSEGSAPDYTRARQSSITLSHPESGEEMEEDEMEEEEEEEEEEMDEEPNGKNDREDESLTDEITDGGCFSTDRQQTEGSSGSSRGSCEEMRSPSPVESLEQSTVSEDVEELESSLDGSQGSSLKQRSLDVHKHRMHCDEGI